MNASDPSLFNMDTMDDSMYYKDFLFYARFFVQRIMVPFLMVTGVVGNVVTIVIMTRRHMRSSTNIYLAALASSDMMYLIFIFFLSLSHYPSMNDTGHYAYWSMKPYVLMLTDTCSNTSVWLTVTFTAERYIAVCHPMKGKVFCTESRAKKAIIVVFCFCFALAIPTPFEWIVEERTNRVTNHTTVGLGYSELGMNDTFMTVYYWLTVIIFIFIPFLLLAIFNSFLIRAVHLSKKQRSAMTRGGNDNSQENKITIMLIAVVILFFLCQTPTACHMLYMTFLKNPTQNDVDLLTGLGNIFNLLMALNSAGNFVLYCLLSQKYRSMFVQMFCRFLRETPDNTNTTYYPNTEVCNENNDSPNDSPGNSSRKSVSDEKEGNLPDESCEPLVLEVSNPSPKMNCEGDNPKINEMEHHELVEISKNP